MKKTTILLIITVLILQTGSAFAQFVFRAGSSGADVAEDIARDTDGNLYLTGHFTDSLDADFKTGKKLLKGFGQSDIFVGKYDDRGREIWSFALGSENADYAYSITLDSKANVYICGSFAGKIDFDPGSSTKTLTSNGQSDGFIAKYDRDGNYIWAIQIGGSGQDETYDIGVDFSENVYAAGKFSGKVDFSPADGFRGMTSWGENDGYLAKYTPDIDIEWALPLGGDKSDFLPGGRASVLVEQNGTSYYYTTVHGEVFYNKVFDDKSSFTTDSLNAYIGKYKADGSLFGAGAASFSGPAQTKVPSNGLTINGDDLYVCGTFSGKLNLNPWPGGESFVQSLGENDIFIVKLDRKLEESQSYGWGFSEGRFDDEHISFIQTDDFGDVYIGGSFSGNSNIGGVNLTASGPAGSRDMFISKYRPSSSSVWTKSYGANTAGTELNQINSVLFTPGRIMTGVGRFHEKVDFDPSDSLAYLQSAGDADLFLSRWDADGNMYFDNYCTGKPTAGRIFSDSLICRNNALKLNLADESKSDGMTILWQQSEDSLNYLNLAEVPAGSTYNSPVLDSDKYFRAILKCEETGETDTTAVRKVLVSRLEGSAGENKTILPGDTLVLGGAPTASGGIGQYKYSWTPASVLDNSSSPNPKFVWDNDGLFNFVLTISDSVCTIERLVQIIVDKNPVTGTEKENFTAKTGLRAHFSAQNEQISLFYELDKNELFRTEIYNSEGKLMYSGGKENKAAGANREEISLPGLSSGLYLVRMIGRNNSAFCKFLKE